MNEKIICITSEISDNFFREKKSCKKLKKLSGEDTPERFKCSCGTKEKIKWQVEVSVLLCILTLSISKRSETEILKDFQRELNETCTKNYF